MKKEIIISSIFEGLMPSALFGGNNEYLLGIGIDPDVPLTDAASDIKAGGVIRPVQYVQFSGAEVDATPLAIINTPQSDLTWAVLTNGKVIAYKDSLTAAESHFIGQVAGNKANGAWYYNNYIYITGTGTAFDDVSRVGPLNTLPYTAQISNFAVGQVVTGAVSGATAMIVSQSPFASSLSPSFSPSKSPSLSPSKSPSISPSPSGAGVSVSPSVSPSPSLSPSKSPSVSPSASLSPSVSPSTSPSGPPTGTLTLSQISGMFVDGEVITDPLGGSAIVYRTFASLIQNNVWKGSTLGSQQGLGNIAYPKTLLDTPYLNHFGFSHSDGASYFLDFKNGRGLIHKIQTTKVTDQGDTNDGSAYQSVGDLSLPHDFLPITAVSYSTDIVISGSKTSDTTVNQGNACLFFWDAAEELFYRVVRLPDPICSVLKYVNGILYGLSGDINGAYRLFRYVGGDTIQTLKIIEDGYVPLQMASDFVGNRLVWGANTTNPVNSSGLYAYGSKSDLFPRGLHYIARSDFE